MYTGGEPTSERYDMTTITVYRTRAELIELLVERDGLVCQHPDCGRPLDLNAEEGPRMVTIDHREPQSWCREQGWTDADIWALDNLDLMCKKCNADKGHRRYRTDGTLEPKPASRFRYRRHKRAERPEICTSCNAGRNLREDEWCNSCGSGPMPARLPKWRQMDVKECDHDLFFCVGCTIYNPEKRRSALDALITGGPGYE